MRMWVMWVMVFQVQITRALFVGHVGHVISGRKVRVSLSVWVICGSNK